MYWLNASLCQNMTFQDFIQFIVTVLLKSWPTKVKDTPRHIFLTRWYGYINKSTQTKKFWITYSLILAIFKVFILILLVNLSLNQILLIFLHYMRQTWITQLTKSNFSVIACGSSSSHRLVIVAKGVSKPPNLLMLTKLGSDNFW